MHIISDFHWYFFPLCFLAGAIFSALLYFKEHKHDDTFSSRTAWILSILRFLSVSFIACLLLAPVAKRNINQHEKPIILVAQDNSQSPLLCSDSSFYKGEYQAQMQKIIKQLSHDYDVHCFTYGTQVHESDLASVPDYSESSTNLSDLFSHLQQQYANRNVGAMVLTGDGIFNQGLNPASIAQTLPFPIFSVALGDTSVRRDAAIANVRYNRLAYLGNQFPLAITIRADRLKGTQKLLQVKQNGKVLFSKNLNYNDDHFTTTEQVLLSADHPGLQTYTIELSQAENEASVRNNRYSLSIEVIDGHQKIAIVSAVPHPDVAAIRQSLDQNQNYEVKTFLASEFKDAPSQYDLIVLHQIPSRSVPTTLAQTVVNAKVPAIFVLGNQSDLGRFNALHTGLEIYSKIDRANDATPLFNPDFSFFTLSEDVRSKVEKFPPLSSPFGEYRTAGTTQSLFLAKIGTVNSGQPLLAFTQVQSVRYAIVCGEGLWRWRMMDYQTNQSHDAFHALINKMVVYSTTQIGKDRFHVETKPIYRAAEPVNIAAELYNENFEPINTPDASLTIHRLGAEKKQTYHFNRSGNNYVLPLGILQPGQYQYQALTTLQGKQLTATGHFVVEEQQLEDLQLQADHALLRSISNTTKGSVLSPQSLDSIPLLLQQRDDIKTVIYSQTSYTDLLNLPIILLLLLILIAAEWILRKYNGTV